VVNALNIVLAASAIPRSGVSQFTHWTDRLFGEGTDENATQPGGVGRFAIGAAIWTTMLAALLSILSYQRHPHVPDELSYLYQARYFAKGLLDLPLPPVPAAFNVDLMNYEATRWFSPVPPGWPAVLAIGAFLGVPWLVNPVFAGINVLLTCLLVRELADRRTANLAVLLVAMSPWHLFMAMSFMPHVVMLSFALAAALAVARARRTNHAIWGLLGGAAVGAASVVRSLDGMVLGVLLGLWLLLRRDLLKRLPSIATFGIGALIVGSLVLAYNSYITGSPTLFPIMAYNDKYYGANSNAFGFGPDRGMGWGLDAFPGHTPLESVINTNLNVFTLNTDLFGWSTGSLVLIALFVAAGRWRRIDRLMIAVILATIGLHAFYWYSGGPDFGPRYWSLTLIPCVLLTLSGLGTLERSLVEERGRALFAVLSLCALALIVYVPWRAMDKYYHFRGMRPDVRELARAVPFGRSLVLVRGCRHPDYASAAAYNPLDLSAAAPIYAWDVDPTIRAKTLAAYADRPVWIVDGPTLTHTGFKVRAGPLSRAEAMQLGIPPVGCAVASHPVIISNPTRMR
jgi:4-amino-4-deoxy-L-arabinose transferase-like glycosyltransferase